MWHNVGTPSGRVENAVYGGAGNIVCFYFFFVYSFKNECQDADFIQWQDAKTFSEWMQNDFWPVNLQECSSAWIVETPIGHVLNHSQKGLQLLDLMLVY